MTAVSDMRTLTPKEKIVLVGEKEFRQKPLSLRGTAAFVSALSDEITATAGSPAIQALLSQDFTAISPVVIVPVAIKFLASLPQALPRLIAVLLTGRMVDPVNSEEDATLCDEIDNGVTLPEATRIFVTFVEQNEPEVLVENFILLRQTLVSALERVQEKQMT